MTKRERVAATLRGEATDRPAWGLWRHFYEAESTAADLARVMLAWAREYDFDFLKVNPRAHYHAEGWGTRYRYSGAPHQRPELVAVPVRQPEDWRRLKPLAPTEGALGEQLEALRLIREGLGGEVPFVETVFTPLGVAQYLVESDEVLLRHLREAPEAVEEGLATIARTFADFARACLDVGCDGIFFATTHWASLDRLTPRQYERFGRPYDLQVLAAVEGAPLNILHVCAERNLLYQLAGYPVAAFNWAATSPTNPSLGEARQRIPGMLIGGLSPEALTAATPALALEQARAAAAATGKRGWALGPNCSIPTNSNPAVLQALREALPTL